MSLSENETFQMIKERMRDDADALAGAVLGIKAGKSQAAQRGLGNSSAFGNIGIASDDWLQGRWDSARWDVRNGPGPMSPQDYIENYAIQNARLKTDRKIVLSKKEMSAMINPITAHSALRYETDQWLAGIVLPKRKAA